MSTKDSSLPESGNRPFPTTRRSLQPGPPDARASTPPPPAEPPSSRRFPAPPPAPAPEGPPSRRFPPATPVLGMPPGLRPSAPLPEGPALAAPPLPWLQDAPLSTRTPSIPPPSSTPSPTTPVPSKSTLPASVQKALVTLDKVKAKLDAIERQKTEPIAIIGMSCRFPGGATSPEAFFRLLENGVDTITRVPPERWTDANRPSGAPTRWGAFLQEDVGLFDAGFFGISPREAERLDPQQRILLELTWEALERAGQVPPALVGSRTGVFMGIIATDYMLLSMETPPETWDLYTATGSAHCFPAGRIAYSFGFQGPTLVVDTACSSSLVSVHLAVQSLRTGESDMAVAGGMNLILSPAMFEMMAKTSALSPDGRCKSFDARADGYVRGEGGGVVVLKRLSEAQRDGDPIFAVIRGSAVNQDGRSTGLTTPNVLSQQAMLRQALESARLQGAEIGYVETHGTGTSLGDPIEFEALRAVFGARREDGSAVVLGAVKTNIGHVEAAAGIAGLLKTALILQHEVIPKNLHFRGLNPRMSFEGTPFLLPTENRPWERGDKPRLAGVSAFGLSGTNAHIILEEAPPEVLEPRPKGDPATSLLPISARTEEALVELARSYADMLDRPEGDSLADIAYTATQRRMHHEHRLAVVGQTRHEIATALSAFVKEGAGPSVARGKASPTGRQKLVFVFSGQGSQWAGMGRQLFQEDHAFRSSIELCHEAIRRHGTFSLIDEIRADEDTSRLGELDVVQPFIFAIQVSLAAMWQAWGVEPDVVIGHSMGEVAAARAAGILSIEDAAKIICRRSRLLVRIAGQGGMAHVELPADEVQEVIAPFKSSLAVAVRNGPRSTVISGDVGPLDTVLATLESKGVFCRLLKVDFASHCPQIDILKEDFAAVLFNLRPREGRIPMVSTVTGEAVRGHEMTAEYWVRNLRDPVLFAPVVQRISEERTTLFVEIGPHPNLLGAIEDNLREVKHEGVAIGTMRRSIGERRAMQEALGALHVRGAAIDWKRIGPARGRSVQLPTYPWQRRKYWVLDSPPEDLGQRRTSAAPRTGNGGMLVPQWQRSEAPAAEPARPSPGTRGPWLLLSERGGPGDALARSLRGLGGICVRALAGHRTARIEPHLWEIDPSDPNGYAVILREGFAASEPCQGIVHLLALDHAEASSAEEIEAAQVFGTESALLLVQAIVRADLPRPPRLLLVTRGSAPVPGSRAVAVAQAPLWGFGRTLQDEHPDLRTKLVDLPATTWPGEPAALLAEILEADAEDQIALRSEARFVARLVRTEPLANAPATDLRSDGTYLITGGLGGLGISFAEWMVGRGARHLVLVGRSAPTPFAQDAIAKMESAGAKVLVVSADVSVRSEVEALFERIAKELPPLRGVLHSAAVIDDHTLLKLSVTSVRDVAAAKMYGAWHLHQATRRAPLDFFVLFASAASLFGPLGQGNYAAANAFLDALAHQRRAEGLPALSVDWGPFSQVGLAAAQVNRGDRVSAMGFRNMTPAEGHEALSALLGGSLAQVGVIEIDVERARESMPRLATSPYFSTIGPRTPDVAATQVPVAPRLLDALRAVPTGERPNALRRIVGAEVARILRLEPDQMDATEPFARYGFDSLMGLELRNRLQAGFAMQLSMADIVTHTRVDTLSDLIADRLAPDESGPITAAPARLAPARGEGSWIVVPRRSPAARLRLFCFPYAGGAAPVFSAWSTELPPEIEVCAIQPPGRHERLHEPLLQSVEEMVASLVPALLPMLDKPFAVFGHCLGAIVMFETLRVLASKHGKRPVHVFASAAPAPHRYLVPTVAALSQNGFADVLRSIGFADESMLVDRDAQEHMMPAVKADFDAAARYVFAPGAPLDVPVTAFAGLDDSFAPIDLVDTWRRETSSRFSKVALPGGHYFIVPERDAVLAHVREEILHRLAALDEEERARTDGGISRFDPCFVPVTPRREPAGRLLCFPGLGEGSLDSAAWGRAFDEDIEVCVLELPGHASRISELPLGRVEDMAALVARAIPGIADLPFVFLGTDLGALIAYETVRILARDGLPLPEQLVVLAAMAPDLHYFAAVHHLRSERFVAELEKYGIPPNRVPERALRADAAALSSYAFTGLPHLPIPISAQAGKMDWFIPLAGVRGWGGFTRDGFTFQSHDGGHVLDDQGRAAVAARLKKRFPAVLDL